MLKGLLISFSSFFFKYEKKYEKKPSTDLNSNEKCFRNLV